MSVLIEAFTVVVRRHSLNVAYPGGADAFLEAIRNLAPPPRFACASDPLLANICFEQRDQATAAITILEAHGLVQVGEPDAVDFVCVDQREGPAAACAWLEWERFTDGVTVAWMAGKEPGALAAPDDWTPAAPGNVSATDVPSLRDRFLPLAVDGDSEILLDLDTGSQVERFAQPSFEMPPAPASLHADLVAALAEAEWTTYLAVAPAIMVDLRGEHALYTCRYFVAEDLRAVVCYTRAPLFIPKPVRRKAMEYITRANHGLLMGSFELNLDDGALFFRATCPVDDGVLTMRMACGIASAGVWTMDRYFPKLLEMIYAKRSAIDAVREAER